MQPRSMPERRSEPGREGVRSLLRRPVVQGLLALTALGQFVATQRLPEGATALAGAEAALRLQPAVVTPAPEQVEAREVEELAERYRRQGYRVSRQLAELIVEAAKENEVDPELAFGLVRAESSFRNSATSRVGAVGLTQLMPATARWMEPGTTRSELRDPETNVRIGLKYLRYLLDRYEGNEDLALLAYNRGPGTVDRALKRGRNPDNGYAAFVRGKKNHGHRLFTR